jgi:hypothetical protein
MKATSASSSTAMISRGYISGEVRAHEIAQALLVQLHSGE